MPLSKMIKYFTILLLLVSLTVEGQNALKGIITDSETGEAIPGANIYLNTSSIGTSSDIDGNFTLDIGPIRPVSIFISFVGYKTLSWQVEDSGVSLKVKLEQSSFTLEEYQVKSEEDKAWQRRMKRFKYAFFGTDELARQCEIQNPWVIEFKRTDGVLTAFADESLIILNKGLGYKVTYLLNEFIISPMMRQYQGLSFFEELETNDPAEHRTWQQNRLTAYNGSMRHFLYAAQNNQLRESRFTAIIGQNVDQRGVRIEGKVPNKSITNLSSHVIFSKSDDNGRILKFSNHLMITYKGETQRGDFQHSSVVSNYPTFVDEKGNLASSGGITVAGHLAHEGFPYLLPAEYEPGQ